VWSIMGWGGWGDLYISLRGYLCRGRGGGGGLARGSEAYSQRGMQLAAGYGGGGVSTGVRYEQIGMLGDRELAVERAGGEVLIERGGVVSMFGGEGGG